MWSTVLGVVKSAFRNVVVPISRQPNRTCSAVSAVSATHEKLMAFFDEEENWGKPHIKLGRHWKLEELRIKSNEDLHKLWYVLLKERNMLLTMEHECNRAVQLFPNPERIDKVKISMENLEKVVRERNTAYHLLETGENGERPKKIAVSAIGLRFRYRLFEHRIPYFINNAWRERHKHSFQGIAVRKFLWQLQEQKLKERRRKMNRDRHHVEGLFKRFPDLDIKYIKEEYPNLNIEKIRNTFKARGHFIPNEYVKE